ncbi:MAG: SRPBCC family protein [Phycisphaerales bacterium]
MNTTPPGADLARVKLRESIDIAAPPEVVWPFVADPVMESAWNPKIVGVDRERRQTVGAGERYRMTFHMGARDHEYDVEVLAVEEPLRVQYAMKTTDLTAGEVRVLYELAKTSKGVRLRQTIDLSRAPIPLPFRALIWLITRLGSSKETPYLDRLREQAERIAEGVPAAA